MGHIGGRVAYAPLSSMIFKSGSPSSGLQIVEGWSSLTQSGSLSRVVFFKSGSSSGG